VIVVDNGSSDLSIQLLAAEYPDCRVIPLEGNHGFCEANNIGIEAALVEGCTHVLLVNNDATLDVEALERLVAGLEARPEVGMVAPLIRLENGEVWSAGGIVYNWQPLHLGESGSDPASTSRVVDWISCCVCLIRRQLLERVPRLYADYFAYYEDVDFCLFARDHGFLSAIVPTALATHHIDRRNVHTSLRVYLMQRNHLIWLRRRCAPSWIVLRSAARAARTLLAWSLRGRYSSLRPLRVPLLLGVFDGLRSASEVRYITEHS
jgi:GT2 family glycosyltransferase